MNVCLFFGEIFTFSISRLISKRQKELKRRGRKKRE